MRSGKLKSKLDHLVNQIVDDPNYRICPTGKVYSLRKKNVCMLVGRIHDKTNASTNAKLYHKVKYKGKELATHRIIYRKFHGELKADLVIDHLDGNGLNNHYKNLEQTTQQVNMQRKFL